MSRKIQRSVWRDGHRRRSPRISALDAWKPPQPTPPTTPSFSSHSHNCLQLPEMEEDHHYHHQGPPSSTTAGASIKRKLQQPVLNSLLTKPKQGLESPNHEHRSTNSDQPLVIKAKGSAKLDDNATSAGQPSVMSPIPFMPEKRILELVLDILQRRDTYEIFAEPVDPKEVEDYYKIIKEPMDFGTMRAKLHEGMYTNLEQFEHDVFLIPRNAMHFNSTATIYFRQARAIDELAKKVFHVLKTEPENFELEFSGTRRRSGRRPQGEGKGLNFNSCPRFATNVRSSSMSTDVSSKGTQCSLSGPSNLRRKIQGKPGFSCTATRADIREYDFSPGARDGGRSNNVEVDRRRTYRPWTSFHNENDSIVSTIYSAPQPLSHVNQWTNSYGESLMLFAKDLGPTAQMIANRKLHGCWKDAPNFQTPASNCIGQATMCQVPAAVASFQKDPECCSAPKTTTTNVIDLTDTDNGEKAHRSGKMGDHSALGRKVVTNREYDGMKMFSVCDRDKVLEKQISKTHQSLCSSISGAEDLKSSVTRINDTNKKSMAARVDSSKTESQVQPWILALEHSHSNEFEFKSRNSNSSTSSSSWPWQTSSLSQSDGAILAPVGPKKGGMMSSSSLQHGGHSVESNGVVPLVSPFAFDLPFLKAQLSQMNHLGQDGFLQPRFQQVSVNEGPIASSSGQVSNKRRTFLCTHHAEPSTQSSQLAMATTDNQQYSVPLDTHLALHL